MSEMLGEGTASSKTALMGWWRLQGTRFLVAAGVTAMALVVAGWVSGLRQIMHSALLTFAVAALLPFVLVAVGLLVIMLVGFVLALLAALAEAEDVLPEQGLDRVGEAVVDGGARLIPRYYRFLGRQRRPVFWGVLAGVLFGGLLLWALIAVIVVPGETRTGYVLTAAKAGIEQVYSKSAEFPRPDDQGHLPLEGIGAPASGGGGAVLEDGFGRPLKYDVSGRWKLSSWTLTSLGFDGKPSADDMCISGSTKLMQWTEKAEHVARLLKLIKSGSASLDDRLAGIRALQCPSQ